MHQVSDLNISKNIPLISPKKLIDEVPRSDLHAARIAASRQKIREILNLQDSKFLLICGPCSIHDPIAGMEYAEKLMALAEQVKDQIMLVMRVYFEKPRTTLGWKGLIMDPHLDGSDDIPKGLRLARHFLRDILDTGLPTATEFLDPITPQYISDLISWSAIGARTTESQTHRQMASGLSMPLGFKNATNGDLTVAVNAINAALQPQTFLGVSNEGVASAVTTLGNQDCHIILRGGSNGPNFRSEDVAAAIATLDDNRARSTIMIDASHANCEKDDTKMPGVFSNIISQRATGNQKIIGAMLESHLYSGNQKLPQNLKDLKYGQSITDKCINWKTTEQLILKAAESLA